MLHFSDNHIPKFGPLFGAHFKLDFLDDLSPDELTASLQDYFDPWWPFAPLDATEVTVLRAVIHPAIVIEKPKDAGQTLKLLDLRQERHARAIGDGHRIIHGVAGSGKTVLLIGRANGETMPSDASTEKFVT
jgi:hypothetical protein